MLDLRYILLICTCLLILHAAGQSPSIRNFNTQDGLPGNITYNVVQDKDGYLWIPTNNGICRYDGREFKVYDSPLIKNAEVLECGEALGYIWFYTFDGSFFYIENEQVRLFSSIDKSHTIKSWVGAGENTLLVSASTDNISEDQIYRIRKTEEGWDIKHFKIPNASYKAETFGKIHNDVYVVSKNGLWKYDEISDELVEVIKENLGEPAVVSQMKDEIIIRSSYTKDKYTYLNFKDNSLYNILLHDKIPDRPERFSFTMFEDNRRRTWLLGETSMWLADSLNDASPKDVSHLLENTRCNNMAEDREGNLWFSSNTKGVYVLYNNSFLHFNEENSNLPNNYIYDIDGDKNGNVFIATHGGALTVMRNDSILDVNKFTNNLFEIYDVFVTSDDEILVSLYNTWRFNFKEDKIHLIGEFANPFDNVKRYAPLNDGSLLLCNRGVILILDNSFHYTYNLNPLNVRIYSALELNDKSILLGTNRGVYSIMPVENKLPAKQKNVEIPKNISSIYKRTVFKRKGKWATDFYNKQVETYDTPLAQKHIFSNSTEEATIDYYVADMQSTSDGSAWIATRKNGVYHIKDNAIQQHYTASTTGLTNNVCNRLHIDADDNVWVATMGGISLINPETQEVQKITTDDGLITNHITSVYTHDSLVYTGTPKGLMLFKKNDLTDQSPPPIIINSVKINEQDLSLAPDYNLNYDDNSLYISFIGLTYKGKPNYKYRLNNITDGWITTTENYVRFPELRPGKYTFEVKSVSQGDVESTTTAAIKFTIRSHPLLSIPAYLLYALLAIGAIVYSNRRRIRRIQAEEAQKTLINKQFAELELQALRAQMNPHFTFNVLNAIQYFIYHKNIEVADEYLAKFALLMRLFLESSKNKFITLAQEIKLLNLYVEMEQMRFEGRLDYRLSVAETIDTQLVNLPSMLLQPFLENAINHGLFHKKTKGLLTIDFRMEGNEKLVCTIEDNGVGREATQNIRKASMKNYTSRSMQIVNERIKTLNSIEAKTVFNISISDLYDNEKDTGTRVIITILIRE